MYIQHINTTILHNITQNSSNNISILNHKHKLNLIFNGIYLLRKKGSNLPFLLIE